MRQRRLLVETEKGAKFHASEGHNGSDIRLIGKNAISGMSAGLTASEARVLGRALVKEARRARRAARTFEPGLAAVQALAVIAIPVCAIWGESTGKVPEAGLLALLAAALGVIATWLRGHERRREDDE